MEDEYPSIAGKSFAAFVGLWAWLMIDSQSSLSELSILINNMSIVYLYVGSQMHNWGKAWYNVCL